MELNDNQYEVQGIALTELASRYELPLYVYDADTMKRQYDSLTSAFGGLAMKVKYACKALNNLSILSLFRSWGSGLDTVSIQEVELGLMAGFAPKDIIYTPNCVSFEEIAQAVTKGVVINIDNLSILEQFGNTFGGNYPCCVRINPHILAGGNYHLQTGHIDSKFGISVYQLRHLLRIVKTYSMNITGLHMHSGSDILDAGVFLQGAEILFDTAKNFPDLQFIDFGSGFKVAYKDDDVVTDIAELGRKLTAGFKEFCTEYGRDLEIWFEPGKYLVSESGYFLVKTNVIKQTVSTVFAGVDSGQNHLIRPMFYDAYHRILNVSNPTGTPRVYSVVGYICETDTFAYDRRLPEVRESDILCFLNAGAYGFTMSSNYNSRFRPAEVLVLNGKDYLIRKRETMDDILHNQIRIDEKTFS
ncbi:MAG: diaminopimelate decarboxylase [Ignavibacteriae bacterium]|nr:diaminopimelate decarboxylase [Ignavibacteriota bacterium]